jgi:GT2 family glycosyltransferase
MSERAPVSVVIVTWNSLAYVDACLGSLRDLARPPAETILVDSGSADGTVARVRERFAEVRVVALGENAGYCRGNNLGIRESASPFVLALNPDTRLTPTFLDELLPAFEDPRVGIASGKLLRFDGATIDSAGQALGRSRQPVDRGYGEQDRGQYAHDEDVFGACGAAALYRRSMIDDVADGGAFFDEAFFAFYEDLDVAWRARKLGYRAVYRAGAVALHARGGTAGSPAPPKGRSMLRRPPELRYHIAKNRYLTILRNDTPSGYLANLPFILARDLAVLGVLLVTSPGVVGRLLRSGPLFAAALEKRRLDSRRVRHQLSGRT